MDGSATANDMVMIAVVSAFLAAAFALLGRIMWDWFQTGRITSEYIKRTECNEHRHACPVNVLNSRYQEGRENDAGHDADIESRLGRVETRLDEGQQEFHAIRRDINCMNKNLARIATVIEMQWGQKGILGTEHIVDTEGL